MNSFWSKGKGVSGGEQIFIQVFKRIRDEFDNIFLYTNITGKTAVIDGGVRNIEFKVSNKYFDKCNIFVSYIFRTIKALSCLKNRKFEIIYSTSDFFPDVIPSYIYKMFNRNTKWFQCVFHVYPDWRRRPGNKLKNLFAQYLQKFSFFLMRKSDCIININNQVRDYLVGNGFNRDNVVVIAPGIDIKYLENVPAERVEKKYDAAFLARLNPSKGINDLIDIWRLVVSKRENAKLAIIGWGSEETNNRINQNITKAKLADNIELTGFLENDAAFSLIKGSKIFIFPSHEEGFGIAIAEAMACSVPVIVWNLPVYSEIYENNIIQIKENDVESFADNVLELLENSEKRTNIAIAAKRFIYKYDWIDSSRRHFDIINSYFCEEQ